MALTKISSNEIQPAAITSDLISADVSLGVKISNVSIANSSYTILDDTAVDTAGGYIVITGAGFNSGAQVIIGGTNATSVTRVSSTELRAQVPAKSAATYNVYVVNTDGSTGIRVNGLTYSGLPTWVTASALANVQNAAAFTGTFDATGATSYSNTTALPDGFNLVSANGYYYGTIEVGSDTNYSFTIRATDDQLQDSDRTFSLLVQTITAPPTVEYLVVAGGGGGGWAGYGGGGGGAGGLLNGNTSITAGQTYTVTVGNGGAGSASRYSLVLNPGGDSSFGPAITAIGGGGGSSAGGPTNGSPGGSGGSGGGGAQRSGASGGSGTAGQGTAGGNATSSPSGDGGGGGGGAGSGGLPAPAPATGGNGGAGSSSYSNFLSLASSGVDSGGTRYIAGGGGGGGGGTGDGTGGLGGGGAGSFNQGGDGVVNTGGGGGGSGYPAARGGNGGKGIVIIRYADTYADAASTTGSPTVINTGGYKIYKFTDSGSITW